MRNVASVSTTICVPQTSKRVLLSFATADTSPETQRCRWMRGDVAMHDAPCPDLHQEEHMESSEPSGYHDQEIAGDDGLGVIADERPPVLRGPPTASSLRFGRPIGAHHTRRNVDTQLHRKKLYAVPFLQRVDRDR